MTRTTDRPLAAPGLTSYRYAGPSGWVMIGARDEADAMREAERSLERQDVDPDRLERWCPTLGCYIEAALPCDACSGTGEVITDWERYLHPQPGDAGDEAVADCEACDGRGRVAWGEDPCSEQYQPGRGTEKDPRPHERTTP